jgi:hypothetical protein
MLGNLFSCEEVASSISTWLVEELQRTKAESIELKLETFEAPRRGVI